MQLRFVWSNSAAAQLLLHHRAGAVGAEMRRKGIYSIHAEHMAAALTSVSCANGEHKKVTEKSSLSISLTVKNDLPLLLCGFGMYSSFGIVN